MAAFSIVFIIVIISLLFLIVGIVQILRAIHRKRRNQKFRALLISGLILLCPLIGISTIFITNIFIFQNQMENDKGPLFIAIKKNDINRVENYLHTNLDINMVRRFVIGSYYEYHTPLSYACLTNNYRIVKLLIEKGADVNKNVMWNAEQKYESLTPSMIACENNNKEILKLLIANGADINKKTNSDSTFLLALKYGDLELIKYLVNNKVDTSLKDIDYTDPPIYTITEYNPKIDLLTYIIDSKIDTNINYVPQNGVNVFMLSIKKNNSNQYTNALISNGATIKGIDIYQNSALDFAYKNSNKEMIKYLIDKGIKKGNEQ
jgi:hypothetical protein